MNNNNKAMMKETSKNCVSDYPLSDSTDNVGRGVKRGIKVSFGRVECREFARTVGDNECVGAYPLCLDWEVLGVMKASVDQYEAFRAPLHKSRKEDFRLATPEERVAVLEKFGLVETQLYRLEKERLNRIKEEWSQHLKDNKHQGPQGLGKRLKRSVSLSAIRRRIISFKSAKKNMSGLMKKLRQTLKRNGSKKATYGPRLRPVNQVPKVKATAWESLVLAQGEVPATFALNLTMKWEKVAVEGKSGGFVCCTCMLECCVVTRVILPL
jgi:hypothetical protein